MYKAIILLIFTSIMMFCAPVFSQNISISASVDKNKMAVNEQLVLQVAVSGDASSLPSPEIPALAGFNVYSSGRSQNISILNGKISSSVNFNYILVPKAAGNYTIAPITLNYNNKIYKTEPITVEVTKSQARSAPQSQQGTGNRQSPGSGQARNVFITTSVDKRTAYVGQQITLTFKFYYNVQMLSQPNYVPPETRGFWGEDLPPQRNYTEQYNGVMYNVLELKKALFPTAPGQFTIGAAQLQCSVSDFSPDSFFGGFFSQGNTQVLKSEPISVNILALPGEGKPAGFSGAVGSYRIKADVDKKSLQSGQPVTLSVTISGQGNIKSIPEPVIPELRGIRKYQTVSSLNLSKDNYRLQGSKVFKTILIPGVSGKLTIPEIGFSFFDPSTRSYRTDKTDEISFNVNQGPKEEQKVTVVTADGVKFIGSDIRHIKLSGLKEGQGNGLLFKSKPFVAFQVLPVLLLIAAYRYKAGKERIETDVKYARYTKAYKSARKGLKEVKNKIVPEKSKDFYSDLSGIFCKYTADKLNHPKAGVTLHLLKQKFSEKNIDGETLGKIEFLWEEFNFARFAPAKVSEKSYMEDIYNKTVQVIDELEKLL